MGSGDCVYGGSGCPHDPETEDTMTAKPTDYCPSLNPILWFLVIYPCSHIGCTDPGLEASAVPPYQDLPTAGLAFGFEHFVTSDGLPTV